MGSKLPPPFIRALKQEAGFEEVPFLSAHEDGASITSIRMNPFKSALIYKDADQVPWSGLGKYLNNRPSFTADPLFHAGCYYVQEASSMFLEQALQTIDLTEPLRVLDLCAAPGGKSTHLLSLLSPESILVSNEIIKSRVNVLAENITKWGNVNTIVTNNDPKDFKKLSGVFDVIVCDAPCSGSGMFRKDADAIAEWSEGTVILCSERQQRILADVLPCLKEGGLLIYSTCSYSHEENEDILDWLADSFQMSGKEITVEDDWGIVACKSGRHQLPGYRFYPGKVKGEGFFISCLIKKQESGSTKWPRIKYEKPDPKLEPFTSWIRSDVDLHLFFHQEAVLAFPIKQVDFLQLIKDTLYIKKAGVKIGKAAGKDIIPDHELAVSTILADDIRRIDLSREDAISYLKREEFKLPNAEAPGWALASFENFPLGWIKVLPNRLNNYYPKELRITNPNIR